MIHNQISDEEIRTLPLLEFKGIINVITTPEDVIQVIPLLQQAEILGFDTETRPLFKKGKKNNVALLQLATNNTVIIFRLNKTGLTDELANILADENIIKVGAAIRDDIKKIKRIKPFKPAGFIDLQQFVKQYHIEQISLKKMTAIVLKGRISKSQQTSNWEQKHLTKAQLIYAATDAWCCLKIYTTLQK